MSTGGEVRGAAPVTAHDAALLTAELEAAYWDAAEGERPEQQLRRRLATLRWVVIRERRRVGALRGAMADIKRMVDDLDKEIESTARPARVSLLARRIRRIAERHMPVTMEEADAPQAGEGR
jgi:hypothetical protein